ncbi:MAG: TonB family protein [Chthoniobacteraceae bacterium]
MSTTSLVIRPHAGNNAWVFAIVATLLFHGLLISIGFYRPHDTLLDLIAHGAQEENNPPPLEDAVEVVQEPVVEKEVPEPPAEANPEFIQPVEIPKVAEAPKAEPTPTPEATPAPTPVVAKTQPPPAATAKPHVATVPKQRPANPSVGTGNGDPNFAPQSVVVGNKDFPKPPYPAEARMHRFQGVVVLAIHVVNGEVSDVSVQSSSGFGVLDASASRWVQTRWRFPKGLTRLFSQKLNYALTQ